MRPFSMPFPCRLARPFVALLTLPLVLLAPVLLTGCTAPPSTHTAGSLYRQLGGTEILARVTGHTLDRVSRDARTGRSFDGINLRTLKQSLADHLCHVADGPCRYEGGTMKNAHADLAVAGSEFDHMVQVLREELDAAGVSTAAKNELLRRLAPMRRDIVTQ